MLDLTWGLRALVNENRPLGHWIACMRCCGIRLGAAVALLEAERLAWQKDEIAAEAAGLVLS